MRYLYLMLCLFTFQSFSQQPVNLVSRLKGASESEKIRIYNQLGQAYALTQPDSAVHYANAGMHLAERQNDRQGQAILLLTLGYINAVHHHPELARGFYNEALGLYRRLHDAAGVAHTYDQLGLLDGSTKNFDYALEYYQDSRDSSGLIKTYEDMGKSLEAKGERDKALSWYLRALTQYEHHKKTPESYFVLLENIGQLYRQKGDSAAAMHYIQEGLRQSTKQGRRQAEVHLLNDKANLMTEERNDAEAIAVYKQALSEAKRYRQPNEQAEALIGIAGILKKQDTRTSIIDLKQALEIAKSLHEPKLAARIYEALAGVYRQKQHYGEAMNALTEQHHLVDSLLNADTVKEISALDSSYMLIRSREKSANLERINRVERAELRLVVVLGAAVLIMLLLLWLYLRKVKRLNSALKHLNEELSDSNRVKDTLFSVIGHDLKGPAGSAAQLFEIMETEELTPDEMKGMIAELHKQTSAALQLLQSLFEWGKAQLQGIKVSPSEFRVQPVVERCINLLSQQAAQKDVRLSAQLPENLKLYADANHFEFIIRNLLSNAIKFSYEGGTISIDGKISSPGEAILSVKDSGIGISADQQAAFLTANLKVKFGTKQEKGSGLGLLLTKDFIKANHGRIWVESEEGKGTTFYIAIPTV